MIRIFIIFLCFLISSCDNNKKSDYPNIILVMTDDQGWGQTGYYNHPLLKTPNLDLMAKTVYAWIDFMLVPHNVHQQEQVF